MEEMKSPEDIRELAYSFRESRILLSAVELRLFSALDGKSMTADQVSTIINADSRATDRLMNSLCGMGLLKKEKGTFRNSELSSKYLVEGKPGFLGNLHHTSHLWSTWSHLTESVRRGRSFTGDQNRVEKGDWVEAFIGAMHYRGVQQGNSLAMMMDLKNARKLLDVGGGSAAFSMEFVKKNPSMIAVVFDLPHVIPLTRKYVGEAGLLDKFTFIEGNYLTDDFGAGYDVILLSAIVHINSDRQNKELIRKCAGALNDNGMVIISDYIMNDDRTAPYPGALFSLNMLVGTEHGDTYTEGEVKEWFESAGLSNIVRKHTSFGSDLMIGVK